MKMNSVNPLVGVTMASLREKTENNTSMLRAKGFVVIEKWEHDFTREKKKEKALKLFLADHQIQDRLNPRDAFFEAEPTLKNFSMKDQQSMLISRPCIHG